MHGERHIRGLIHCSGDDMVLEVIPVDIRLQRRFTIVTKRRKVMFSISILEQDDLCALYCSCHAAITLIRELTRFMGANLEVALHGADAMQVVI